MSLGEGVCHKHICVAIQVECASVQFCSLVYFVSISPRMCECAYHMRPSICIVCLDSSY